MFFKKFVALIRRNPVAGKYVLLLVVLAAMASVSFAQTPVPIVFDTNSLFVQVNSWIVTLWPAFSVGAAIAIAAALITVITSKIIAAVRGN